MRFGLQKLTLLDFPGKVACTIFTGGCNFRCPFCHNASLVIGGDSEMELDRQELLVFLAGRKKVLDGVCITGGEPLLHPELPEIIGEIKELGLAVKLDTNGSFPDKLATLLDRGRLDYVAMDIKNSPEKYALTIGGADYLAQIRRSVELLKAGTTAYEFRTTVVGGYHETADFQAIGQWLGPVPHYFLQCFKDSGNVLKLSESMSAITDKMMENFLKTVKKYIPAAAIRGQ